VRVGVDQVAVQRDGGAELLERRHPVPRLVHAACREGRSRRPFQLCRHRRGEPGPDIVRVAIREASGVLREAARLEKEILRRNQLSRRHLVADEQFLECPVDVSRVEGTVSGRLFEGGGGLAPRGEEHDAGADRRVVVRPRREGRIEQVGSGPGIRLGPHGECRGVLALPVGGSVRPFPQFPPKGERLLREQRGSTSLLQRALGIGYGRASRLIDFMTEDGLLGRKSATR